MALATAHPRQAGARLLDARERQRARLRSGSGRDRVVLSGVLIDRISLAESVAQIAAYLRSDRLHQIVTVNLDFLQIAQVDSGFRKTINEADLAVADGMPLVWASRLAGRPLPERDGELPRGGMLPPRRGDGREHLSAWRSPRHRGG